MIDENLPIELVDELRAFGHEVDHVKTMSLAGHHDPDIWLVAQEEGRLLVTQDVGFGDARRLEAGSHFGFALVRLDQNRSGIIKRMREIFASETIDAWSGCIVVVTEHKVRVRRPSEEP
jgi:predicted nuclease of predicted toxin-antitoxin system